MLSVLQFRLNRRYVQADPPFVAIELDQSDSGREGCAVSTLTITSEPKDWRGAIQARHSCCFRMCWGKKCTAVIVICWACIIMEHSAFLQ